MAESLAVPDIVVRIGANYDALVTSLKEAGVNVEKFTGDTKKYGELSSGGMRMLSESVTAATQSVGVAAPAARKLGTEVERVVMSFGSFAAVAGVTTIAISSVAAIYAKLTAAQKETREELERSVSSMKNEVMTLYTNRAASADAQRATYDLALAKRQLLLAQVPYLIYLENEKLREQEELLKNGGSMWERFKIAVQDMFTVAKMDDPRMQGGLSRALEAYMKSLPANVDIIKAKLAELWALFRQASTSPDSFEQNQYTDLDRAKNETELMQAQLNLRKSQGAVSLAEQFQMENDIFNMQAYERMLRITQQTSNDQRIYDEANKIYIQGETMKNNQAYALEMESYQNAATVFGGLSQLMDRFYSASGQKSKAFFYLSRGLAAAGAFCQYQLAASDQAGKNNEGMATYYRIMSIGVPAAILAETFMGNNSSDPGGGAPASASSSPVSGLSQTIERTQDIHIYINGQPTDVPKLTEKIVREIGRNNGSVGGFSVGISGTA